MKEKIEEIENWIQQDLFQLLEQFQKRLNNLNAEKTPLWQKKKKEKQTLYRQSGAICRFIDNEMLFLTNVCNYFSDESILSEKEYNDRKKVYPKIMEHYTDIKKLSSLPEKDLVLCLIEKKERLKRNINIDHYGIVLSSNKKTDAVPPYEKEVIDYLQKYLTQDLEQKNPYQSMEDILLDAIVQDFDYQKYQDFAKTFVIQKEKNKLILNEKVPFSKYSKEALLKTKRTILSILFQMKTFGDTSNQEVLAFEYELATALAAVTRELKDSNPQTLK